MKKFLLNLFAMFAGILWSQQGENPDNANMTLRQATRNSLAKAFQRLTISYILF